MSHTIIADSATLQMPLTPEEQRRLIFCEQMIANGLIIASSVVRSMIQIKQEKLYRETHGTFEDYCRDKFGMLRKQS